MIMQVSCNFSEIALEMFQSTRKEATVRPDIILEDTTLRDGEQTPGVAFSKEVKLAIYDSLVAAGVRWIEPGIPAMGGEEVETLKCMLERSYDTILVAWNRGIKEDVAVSLDLGFKAVHIGLPTSKIHLESSVNKDRTWLMKQSRDIVRYAKDRGAFVSISAEDVGRTDLPFLQEYACNVYEAGADRIRLSDTIGIVNPEHYASIVKSVVEVCPIDIQCHTHNDFGLAVANTLAGLQAGARYFHVTVNAIGERAGMPDLAQAVMALKHLYQVDVGVTTTKLSELSRLVASATKQPLPLWQPIVGENVFAHESGIHVNAMLKNTNTFEPFGPEEVGGERRYVIGKHSGRALIHALLAEKGIEADNETLASCLERVRSMAIEQKGAISLEQLLEIYHLVEKQKNRV